MYVQKKLRQKISAAMAAVMILGNSLNTVAAPALEGTSSRSSPTVETDAYRAELNLEKGSVLVSRYNNREKNWNITEGMLPGATMLLQTDGTVKEAGMTVNGAFNNTVGNGGAAGIRMSGELSGVKSWFLFGNEIVCLGAGIQGSSGDTVINVVDNVPVDKYLKLSLTNPAKSHRVVTDVVKDGGIWVGARDHAIQQQDKRNWLTASGLSKTADGEYPLEWHYIFGDELNNSNVYCRFPTTDGTTVSRFEMWLEPVEKMYKYTLGAGGILGDFNGLTTAPSQNTVLSNTESLQAAESPAEGLMAVNKWESGATDVTGEVANVSLNQPVSLFIKKVPGADRAFITVSGLSTELSSPIELSVDLKTELELEITNPPSAVTDHKVENGKILLTLDAAQLTNPATVEVSLKTPEDLPEIKTSVETSGYKANLNLSRGTLLLSRNSDKTKDWNIDDGMSPGSTMFLDSNGQVRAARMSASGTFDNNTESGGAAGVRMSGELLGVKSWFMFDNEIVCLGAGIKNTGESQDKVINVVDNVAADKDLRLGLTKPDKGYRAVANATKDGGNWASARDQVTPQIYDRNWLSASKLPQTEGQYHLEWHYIFDDTLTNSNVNCRFPTTDGKTAERFELWQEPVGGKYQYTLGAGGIQGEWQLFFS